MRGIVFCAILLLGGCFDQGKNSKVSKDNSVSEDNPSSEASLPPPVVDPRSDNPEFNLEVSSLLKLIKEERIRFDIDWLSSFKTRHFQTQDGVDAVLALKKKWEEITKLRSDIKISLINHVWPQPSLKLTIEGKNEAEIIIGGHVDSINTDSPMIDARAPGADDNASGISVMTEVIRVLVETGFSPKNKISFIAYAAEEVGLKGSFEIAKDYADENRKVLGVLNLDGTNYNGSAQKIVLISDNTSSDQNKFLGNLIDQYLKVDWGYDSCGYACSDHYAWNYNGYKASYPFESLVKDENPRIHTEEDSLVSMFNSAAHSLNFAKLTIAFILESDE